ncbi:MAG: serine/threonine protein kinase [Deltaproteobacteria bacterium]|nr:serine/threonine protein kinase [Deltaproteobacteria bacterium]
MNEPCDPVLERAQVLVGQVLRDKWHLDGLIGVGGMASVFAATHRNGRRGAVKLLHTEFSLDKAIRSRFLREGYVANKVGHPGTVEILDDDVAETGSVFLVMELLEGESVDRRWTRNDRRLPPKEVLVIADRVLDVLAAAHDKGIVHRDVKPENMFITREGVVKMLDFGIARLREVSTASVATRFGTTLGTPAYMSPEQALGRNDEVDSISDLWAVGASMFTLLTGRHVHGGKTINEQLVAAATRAAPQVATVDPDVPPRIAAIIDKALSFERVDRYGDARVMQRAVREAYFHLYGSTVATAPQLEVPDAGYPDLLDEAQTQAINAASLGVQTTMKPATASRPVSSSRRQRFRRWQLWAVGIASLVLGGAIAVTGWRANSQRSVAASATVAASPQPSASTGTAPAAPLDGSPVASSSAAASAEPAALPSASSSPAEASGLIAISAVGGGCAVTVDGVSRGATPTSVAVPPGEHHVVCTSRDGTPQASIVQVRSRETTRATFHLRAAEAKPPAASAAPPAPTASAPDPRDRRK